jgi:DNA uptake protein ComE-like DNA-binding protein
MKQLFAVLLALTLGLTALGCGADKDPTSSSRPAAMQAKAAAAQATESKSGLIDINRASRDELMTLKGIGEVRARAIVRKRPYARKDELVQKKIIPQSVYDDIKDQIIARQK